VGRDSGNSTKQIDGEKSGRSGRDLHGCANGSQEDHVSQEVKQVLVDEEGPEDGQKGWPSRIEAGIRHEPFHKQGGKGGKYICSYQEQRCEWKSAVFGQISSITLR
jgi:hypothetical protein